MARAEASSPRHLLALDGLRAASIIPVVWHHSTPRPLEGALGRGPLGVDLFFALSGYLITSLLLRERRAADGGGRIDLARFWARRSLRLFPLYYLVLLFYVGWAALLAPEPVRGHFFRCLPFYATYTGNWFAPGADHPVLFAFSWSLATEEQFYVLWAPVLRFVRGVVGPALVMLGLVVLDQLAERGVVLEAGTELHRIVTSFATPIGLGCLVALACDHDRLGPVVVRVLRSNVTRATALLLALAAFAIGIPLLLAHASFALLVGCAAHEDGSLLFGWARRPAAVWVGRVSYGIYLLHVTVIAVVHRVFPSLRESAAFVFAVSLPLSIALASGAFQLVERPLLGLRARLRVGA